MGCVLSKCRTGPRTAVQDPQPRHRRRVGRILGRLRKSKFKPPEPDADLAVCERPASETSQSHEKIQPNHHVMNQDNMPDERMLKTMKRLKRKQKVLDAKFDETMRINEQIKTEKREALLKEKAEEREQDELHKQTKYKEFVERHKQRKEMEAAQEESKRLASNITFDIPDDSHEQDPQTRLMKVKMMKKKRDELYEATYKSREQTKYKINAQLDKAQNFRDNREHKIRERLREKEERAKLVRHKRNEPLSEDKLVADIDFQTLKESKSQQNEDLRIKQSERSMKRRQELLQTAQVKREITQEQLDAQLLKAQMLREQKAKERIERQRKRAERAKQVREKRSEPDSEDKLVTYIDFHTMDECKNQQNEEAVVGQKEKLLTKLLQPSPVKREITQEKLEAQLLKAQMLREQKANERIERLRQREERAQQVRHKRNEPLSEDKLVADIDFQTQVVDEQKAEQYDEVRVGQQEKLLKKKELLQAAEVKREITREKLDAQLLKAQMLREQKVKERAERLRQHDERARQVRQKKLEAQKAEEAYQAAKEQNRETREKEIREEEEFPESEVICPAVPKKAISPEPNLTGYLDNVNESEESEESMEEHRDEVEEFSQQPTRYYISELKPPKKWEPEPEKHVMSLIKKKNRTPYEMIPAMPDEPILANPALAITFKRRNEKGEPTAVKEDSLISELKPVNKWNPEPNENVLSKIKHTDDFAGSELAREKDLRLAERRVIIDKFWLREEGIEPRVQKLAPLDNLLRPNYFGKPRLPTEEPRQRKNGFLISNKPQMELPHSWDDGHNKMAPYDWSEVVEKEKSTKVKKKRSPEERKQRKAEKERLRGQMDLSHVEQEDPTYDQTITSYSSEIVENPIEVQRKYATESRAQRLTQRDRLQEQREFSYADEVYDWSEVVETERSIEMERKRRAEARAQRLTQRDRLGDQREFSYEEEVYDWSEVVEKEKSPVVERKYAAEARALQRQTQRDRLRDQRDLSYEEEVYDWSEVVEKEKSPVVKRKYAAEARALQRQTQRNRLRDQRDLSYAEEVYDWSDVEKERSIEMERKRRAEARAQRQTQRDRLRDQREFSYADEVYNWSDVEKERSIEMERKRRAEARAQRQTQRDRLRGQRDFSYAEKVYDWSEVVEKEKSPVVESKCTVEEKRKALKDELRGMRMMKSFAKAELRRSDTPQQWQGRIIMEKNKKKTEEGNQHVCKAENNWVGYDQMAERASPDGCTEYRINY